MGKLGKKARKFAKKNLQSVDKRKRKLSSTFKRKHSSGHKKESSEVQVGAKPPLSNERFPDNVVVEDLSFNPVCTEDDSDSLEDDSGSDGFLSEDSSCEHASENEKENDSERSQSSVMFEQNQKLQLELAKQRRKLEGLSKKDPEFEKFLDARNKDSEKLITEEIFSDGERDSSDLGMIAKSNDESYVNKSKVLRASAIDSCCELIMAQKFSAFPGLLNAYRAACHYGSDEGIDAILCERFHICDPFCKTIMFVLQEADGIFRRVLGISSSNSKMESILDLKNSSKWKTLKPLIKSYLRSTLFLINQVSDSEILVFALTCLRSSIIFFAAFPSLQRRLIKAAVHLWATGGEAVSSSAILILRNVALLLSPDCHDTCLIKTYKAFIAHCKIVESSNLKHLQFLMDSIVDLYSLDVPKSSSNASMCIQQLTKILQLGLKIKNKEAVKKIYNWQYINCIDLWVKFISINIKAYDLQPLLYLIIQVINGVAHLFPGPRYFPLRLKCIQMLNQLSSSSGLFIPVTSLVLDSLEFIGSSKPDTSPRKSFDVSSVLKVPKQWLKLQYFQEELVLSSIKLFCVHFSQWSLHISFPELAAIPLIRLKKFHDKITAESLRHPVKRLIDQVEQNSEFVKKKRDDVAFSPKDLEAVESFLQPEACKGNVSFSQYYSSVIQKSISRDVLEKTSKVKRKISQKQRSHNQKKSSTLSNSEKVDSVDEKRQSKKQRT